MLALLPSTGQVFSFRSVPVFIFLFFCIMLLSTNTICQDITNVKKQPKAYEYTEGETIEDDLPTQETEEKSQSWREFYCHNQESAIGQVAILIVIMTAVRLLMTKGF